MGKYEKRRVFRQYRRAGIPFILAQKLARLKEKGAWALGEGLPECRTESITYCDCCGPVQVRVFSPDGRSSWLLDYFSLLPA